MKIKPNTGCYCEDGPTTNKDHVFLEGDGFICIRCNSNVYYIKPKVSTKF